MNLVPPLASLLSSLVRLPGSRLPFASTGLLGRRLLGLLGPLGLLGGLPLSLLGFLGLFRALPDRLLPLAPDGLFIHTLLDLHQLHAGFGDGIEILSRLLEFGDLII